MKKRNLFVAVVLALCVMTVGGVVSVSAGEVDSRPSVSDEISKDAKNSWYDEMNESMTEADETETIEDGQRGSGLDGQDEYGHRPHDRRDGDCGRFGQDGNPRDLQVVEGRRYDGEMDQRRECPPQGNERSQGDDFGKERPQQGERPSQPFVDEGTIGIDGKLRKG